MGDIIGSLFGKEGKSKSKSSSTTESGNNNFGLINSIFGPAASGINNYQTMMSNLLGINNPVQTNPGYSSPIPGGATGGGGVIHTGNGSTFDGGEQPGIQPGTSRLFQRLLGRDGGGNSVGQNFQTGVPAAVPAGSTATDNPQQSALEQFTNSAGMNFLRDQGIKTINADKSAKGLLQSGSTGVALEKFGQGLASTYLNQYMQNLFEQQRIQLGAGGLLASAGQYSKGTGTSSGSSNQGKHGLIPDILVAAAAAGGGG